MADDQRFEQWWAEVALPQLEQHAPGFLIRQWGDKIKQGAQAAWNAGITWNKPTNPTQES